MAMPKIINDVPMSGWVRVDQVEKTIEAIGEACGFRELQK